MMGVIRTVWHILRCLWYGAALTLCWLYSLALFVSKPGARFLLPIGAWLAIEYGLERRTVIDGYYALRDWALERIPSEALALYQEWAAPHIPEFDPMIGVYALLIGFAGLLWVFSRAIRPIIGAMPPPRRPLPPVWRRRRRIEDLLHSARARRAVPRLNHALWNGDFAPMLKRMPAPVAGLLIGEPPQKALASAPRSRPEAEGEGAEQTQMTFRLEPEAS